MVADIYSIGDDLDLPHHGYTVDCEEDLAARSDVQFGTFERATQSLSLRLSTLRGPWKVRRRDV